MPEEIAYPDSITNGAAVSPPPTWLTSYRPAAPRNGLLGYATDTNQLELYQAGLWQQVQTTGTGPINILNGYEDLPGAKGDGVIMFKTVAVSSGTPTRFVITGGYFDDDDIGKRISIDQAGAGGIPLVTTIATVPSAGVITTTEPATSFGTFTEDLVVYGTSDSAAISAILQAVRADGGILIATAIANAILFPAKIYIIDFPLDFTDFHRLYVLAPGATFWGITDGLPVVDAFGFYQGVFDGLTIIGDEGAPPNIGIAGGRYNSDGAHGLTHVRDVLVRGYFNFTPIYSRGWETTTWVNVRGDNLAAGAWAYVIDGINHWNIQSEWVTVNLAVDTAFSNSLNTHIGCAFIAYALTSNGIWASNIVNWRFITQYTRTRGYGLYFYNVTARSSYINYQGTFDGPTVAYIFVEKASATALNRLVLDIEGSVVSGVSVFAASSAGNPCLLQACDLTIQEIEAGGNLFADVAEWTVYGNNVTIVLPSSAPTLPATFYGTVSISQATTTIYHATVIP